LSQICHYENRDRPFGTEHLDGFDADDLQSPGADVLPLVKQLPIRNCTSDLAFLVLAVFV
jgi:hypothetical protein